MPISFKQSGDFKNLEGFLNRAKRRDFYKCLDQYGREGVRALESATPKDTGKTAKSWYYRLSYTKRGVTISWHNDNVVDGVPLVILLEYGHGTGTGGFVKGKEFIDPAILPIFNKIADAVWKEVIK